LWIAELRSNCRKELSVAIAATVGMLIGMIPIQTEGYTAMEANRNDRAGTEPKKFSVSFQKSIALIRKSVYDNSR